MKESGMESRERKLIMLLMAEMLVKRGLLSDAEKARMARMLEREGERKKGKNIGESGNL